MAYHVVSADDVEPMAGRSAEARPIGEVAGLPRRDAKLGIRVYTADPGDQLPRMYHYHDEQIEVFYVLEGTLYVETPEKEFVVPADHAFFAEPGSPHRAFNPADAMGSVRVLAIGAPSVEDGHEYEPNDE